MGLETGNLISQLIDTNPTGSDDVSQGDDHLRLVKRVLKNTFPGSANQGFAKQIVATEDELNYLQGATDNIQAQLDALSGGSSSLDARVTQNEADIASNVTGIGTNQNNIFINQYDIAVLQGDTISNTNRIAANEGNIASNTSRIETIEGELQVSKVISGSFNGVTLQKLGGTGDWNIVRTPNQSVGYFDITLNRNMGSFVCVSSSSQGYSLNTRASGTKLTIATTNLINTGTPENHVETNFILYGT